MSDAPWPHFIHSTHVLPISNIHTNHTIIKIGGGCLHRGGHLLGHKPTKDSSVTNPELLFIQLVLHLVDRINCPFVG